MTDREANLSGTGAVERVDPRTARTRRAIIDAFGRLVLRSRKPPIRAADVVAEAGVGRSTFYEHFTGAEQVQLAALAGPLAILADAATGRGEAEQTDWLLRHFWENRQRARDMLQGRAGEQAQRLLAELVEQRLDGPLATSPGLAARQLSAAAFAPVRAWLLGEVSTDPAALAQVIRSGGAALLASMQIDRPGEFPTS